MDRARESKEERRRGLFPPSAVGAWVWRMRFWSMRWIRTRRSRRLVVVMWVGVLGDWLWMTLRTQPWGDGGMDGWFSFLLVAVLMGLGALVLYGSRRAHAKMSLEDRAFVEHGVEFERLSEPERELLFKHSLREQWLGRAERDEREEEPQQRAARTAFRILRPGLVLFLLVYWGVCFSRPSGSACAAADGAHVDGAGCGWRVESGDDGAGGLRCWPKSRSCSGGGWICGRVGGGARLCC
jgi:hypothetical protein